MTSSLASGPALVAMTAATFILAGMMKGVTGMGLSTVAMGILGSLVSPVAVAATLLSPSLISNLSQFGGGGNTRQLLRRLWPTLLTVVAATLLASAWITGGNTTRIQFTLDVALVAYAIWTLAGKKIAVALQYEKLYSLVIGFVTGSSTGGTGVFVTPAVSWIQSLGFEKDELVQALGISFTFSTLALALGLQWHNMLSVQSLSLPALTIFPVLTDQWIGTRVRRVISPFMFKHCLPFCLAGLGTKTMLRVA